MSWRMAGRVLALFLAIVLSQRAEAAIYGFYSSGCFDQASQVDFDGTGFQTMRLSRERYFAHASLLDFVSHHGRQILSTDKRVVLIGDVSNRFGGEIPGGHKSHQVGLDVDIWYWHPPESEQRSLSYEEREELSAQSLVTEDMSEIDRNVWRSYHYDVLRLAALDQRVQRVFVNAVIKRELCLLETTSRQWLKKIRPWTGHNYHYHVRLYCPSDEARCVPQEDPPEGDGCDEVDDWIRDQRKRPTLELPLDSWDMGFGSERATVAPPPECATIGRG